MDYFAAKKALISFLDSAPSFGARCDSLFSKIAFLVGPWGIGKTYLSKEVLSLNSYSGKKIVYYSLAGKTDAETVDRDLYSLLLPKMYAFGEATKHFSFSLAVQPCVGASSGFSITPSFRPSLSMHEARKIRHL
jgi:hypothetical protein